MADRDQLLSSLRYQINSPRVTTMGYCAAGCGQVSRGAGVCFQCLLSELDALGVTDAREWVKHQSAAHAAWERMTDD